LFLVELGAFFPWRYAVGEVGGAEGIRKAVTLVTANDGGNKSGFDGTSRVKTNLLLFLEQKKRRSVDMAG
jgi:hypothetical protein